MSVCVSVVRESTVFVQVTRGRKEEDDTPAARARARVCAQRMDGQDEESADAAFRGSRSVRKMNTQSQQGHASTNTHTQTHTEEDIVVMNRHS